jgi:hypothetical protein
MGEERLVHQPFKIDRLPAEVREAIRIVREEHTWQEIEDLSALPFNPNWRTEGGGFVNWDSLRVSVQALFPGRRIPHSNLHRWFDVRVRQGTPAL